jgi:hypothetical protein
MKANKGRDEASHAVINCWLKPGKLMDARRAES